MANSSSGSRFVVLKQGHAGSLWLHSLLNAQPGVLSFFEFDGCDKRSDPDDGDGGDGGDDGAKKAAWLEASISNVLSQGCCYAPACNSVGQANFAPAGADTAGSFAYACMRRELCNGHCRPRPRPGCAAVGLQRKLSSNALRLLQPLFAPLALPRARLVLLVRHNAVKHTFSSLRVKGVGCRETRANHVRDASQLAGTARTRVQIPPPLLFGRAAMQLRQRTELVREAEMLSTASGGGVHVIVYERLQMDTRLAMARYFL